MLRRSITALLISLLLVGAAPLTHAQEGDRAYFEAFEGIQRIVARNWMAPLTVIETEEVQMVTEEGKPMAGWRTEPLATPEPQAGIGQFTVFVYLFEGDEHATDGFERIDAETQETLVRDPRAPMGEDLPLGDIGDQAVGYTGDLEQDDVTITYSFATVRGGPFVYQLFSVSAGVDAAGAIREAAEALVRQPMNRMAEQYDPQGGSRGGIWSKFDSVHPDMPEGSEVIDLIIYPMPEEEPGASPVPEFPRLDLTDPASIAGLESLAQARYTEGGGATPASETSGVFRIDAWILTFRSADEAHEAANGLDNTLIEPFGMFSGGSSSTGSWDLDPTYSSWNEGFILDRSLPAGNGAVVVQQEGATLMGVAVYAVDEDPRPVAETVAMVLLERGFPEAGDPALQGLVIAEETIATPVSQDIRGTRFLL